MFLFKRGKFYHLEYFDDRQNRVRRISTGCRTKNEAHQFLTQFTDKIRESKKVVFISLKDFSERYQQYVRENYSGSYSGVVETSFRLLIASTGNIPLANITYQQLEKFFTTTFQRTKEGARTYYIALRSAFNKAIKWDYLKENPISRIKLPKIPKNNPLFITENEFAGLIKNEPDQTLRDIYALAFNTGLRLGEITNLKWSQIDLQQLSINIKNSEEFTTKSKRERVIPINSAVQDLLIRVRPKILFMTKNNYVFTKTGIKFNNDYITRKFKKCIKSTELNQQLHFHDLRHSFASNMARKGISIFIIRELLGHQDVKTTQIYSHLVTDDLRNAVNVLES